LLGLGKHQHDRLRSLSCAFLAEQQPEQAPRLQLQWNGLHNVRCFANRCWLAITKQEPAAAPGTPRRDEGVEPSERGGCPALPVLKREASGWIPRAG
jgi:hypothetical protein